MEFLKGPKESTGCIFCALSQDRPEKNKNNLILYRGDQMFVVLNKYPYNNGHLMVVPYRHTADYTTLTDEELLEMSKMTQLSIEALKTEYKPEGFNSGLNLGAAAGAGIQEHLHLHLIPRWIGDTNFLPLLAETKAMPQHLAESFDRLHPHYRRRKNEGA